MRARYFGFLSNFATKWAIAGARIIFLGMLSWSAALSAEDLQAQKSDPVASALLRGQPDTSSGQEAVHLSDGRWLISGGEIAASSLIIVDTSGHRYALPASLSQPRVGHSSSVLPNGQVLIFGGTGLSGAILDTAELFDPASSTVSLLGSVGLSPRTNHTATTLADGKVLIAGGRGANGAPLLEAEIFDPKTLQAERLDLRLDKGRREQIAALLPDSSVLLWAGVGANGASLSDGDRYDSRSKSFSSVSAANAATLSAELYGSGDPQIMESVPASHASHVGLGEPIRVRFSKRMDVTSFNGESVTLIGPQGSVALKPVTVEGGVVLFVTPTEELLPGASYTLFIDGATDDDGRALPFSAITFETERIGEMQGASGVSSSSGSSESSEPASSALNGAAVGPIVEPPAGASNVLSAIKLALAAVGSAGADAQASDAPLDDGEVWQPNARNLKGDWTSRRRHWGDSNAPSQDVVRRAIYGDPEVIKLSANLRPRDVSDFLSKDKTIAAKKRRASSSTTGVAGQVLKLDGKPLAGATLSVGTRTAMTGANGEFLLSGVASGKQILIIDGSTANRGERRYGRYEYGIDVEANKVNALPFVIWMTRLDVEGDAEIAAPTTSSVVLTNPKIPGLELHIPPGTVIRDAQGRIVSSLNMTAIPTDQPPFPIPSVPVPTYFTIQPGGAHLEAVNGGVSRGAQLIYPNFAKAAPGTRIDFWNYDAVQKGWYIYGRGTVTANGEQVVPDSGVAIYEFTGAMISVPGNAPLDGPPAGSGDGPPDGSLDGSPNGGSPNGPPNGAPHGPPDGRCEKGDPVDCSTGLFINEGVDLSIRDVTPIEIKRTYRQKDNVSRAFGIGTNLSYDTFLVGDTFPYTYIDLVLPNGGKIHYPRISSGTSYTDAVYQSKTTPGKYYGSIIRYTSSSDANPWLLTLKNGTSYKFADSYNSTSARSAAITSISDRNGNTVGLQRDSSANLTKITSPNGRHLYLTYDSANRITLVKDDAGRTVQYTYDGAGRLTAVTDPRGYAEHFSYNSNNAMLSVTDKRGNVKVTNTYDTNGRVATQTYADGTSSSFSYVLDGSGSKVTQSDYTNTLGIVSRVVFGNNGYPLSVTDALGTAIQNTTIRHWNTTTGLIDSVSDALGRTTSYSYDALGNLTQQTQADNTTLKRTVDLTYSLPTKTIDATGKATTFGYDVYGNLTSVTDPLNHTATLTYDSEGRVLSVTDPRGKSTSMTYMGADLVSISDPLGRTIILGRDSLGRVTSTLDASGRRTLRAYDALDHVVSQTDAGGSVTQLSYDQNGNNVSVMDPTGHSMSFGYDGVNRVVSRTDALLHLEGWTYNGEGQVTSHMDRNSQLTQYSYDDLGRLKQTTFADTATVTNSYDAGSRVSQIVDSVSGTILRSYDLLDRVTQEQTPQGTVSYAYDAAGRRTSLQVGSDPATIYGYDAVGRLSGITRSAETVTFEYDASSRRTSLTLPNGVTTQYVYDDANQITHLIYSKGTSTLGTIDYGYDNAGRRISTEGTWAPTQLPAATVTDFQYDNGNRLTGGNAYAPQYDAEGQMLEDGKGKSFSWDARHRLIGISQGVSTLATFSYDALGRRTGKAIGSQPSVSYLYAGVDPVQEIQGGVSRSILTGLSTDERFARDDTGGRTYFLTDALNSTLALTDGSGGVVQKYSYDPYGTVLLSIPSSTSTNPYQYTGRENDETDLYYYRARYYSPGLQRFISEDPMGLSAGPNVYAYVGGNPISLIDPTGLYCLTADQINYVSSAIGGGIGGAVGGAIQGGAVGGLPGAVVLGIAGAIRGAGVGQISQIAVSNGGPMTAAIAGAALNAGAPAVGAIAGLFEGLGQASGAVLFPTVSNTVSGTVGGLLGGGIIGAAIGGISADIASAALTAGNHCGCK